MKNYKIAFCGLGSIGQRHLKNTVRYLETQGYSYQIDAVRSESGTIIDVGLNSYISDQYTYDDVIPGDYDIIFITNPTSLHTDCIKKYSNCTKSMFVEKPLTDDFSFDTSEIRKDLICYVACPLRYTKVLQYIKRNVACDKAYSVRAVCSTYLPNWRPGQDYRKSYSAHKDMGGGVAIDLIHEWDYLIWLFGKPDNVKCIQAKISKLEIDSEDIAVYIGGSDSKVYELHLDYFGRKEVRKLEIYMPDETINVDIREKRIYFSNSKEEIILCESRDEYQLREIEHFFDILEGRCINDNKLEQAMDTLRIARGI
jgi:predicted dehydrogenase